MQISDKIKITMLPAKAGDCILIEFLKENYHILIDGGYADTYYNYLKDILADLSAKGKRIQLLVITHIDADHIRGIQAFLRENGDADNPVIIGVDEVWYNAFSQIETEPKQQGSVSGYLRMALQGKALQGNINSKSGSHDISVTQGNTVAELLLGHGYHWNERFMGRAVCTENVETVMLSDKIRCNLLNPGKEELNQLVNYWISDMKRNIRNFKIYDDVLYNAAFEGSLVNISTEEHEREIKNISSSGIQSSDYRKINIVEWETRIDHSITNRSSISFLLQYDDITLLFPGDCPIQLFQEKLPKYIDVVKLPHHGSWANISREFIKNTSVSYYLLSTDGEKYGHPSPSVIRSIMDEAPIPAKIIKNYDLSQLETIGETEGEALWKSKTKN